MLRCWGGNVYENDLFFDTLRRKGIMVWQDFAMACAVYPQDDEFRKRCRAARRAGRAAAEAAPLPGALVRGQRVRCLAYYWGGRRRIPTRTCSPARCCRECCGRRIPGPYIPSSPYMDSEAVPDGSSTAGEPPLGAAGLLQERLLPELALPFRQRDRLPRLSVAGVGRASSSPRASSGPTRTTRNGCCTRRPRVPGVELYDYRIELMADAGPRAVRRGAGQPGGRSLSPARPSQAEAKKFFIELFRAPSGGAPGSSGGT